MNKARQILWGLIFVTIGVLSLLNLLEVIQFNIFFKGWWCILIMLYAIIELITSREKLLNIYFLVIGFLLFVAVNDYLSFAMIFKILLPISIIALGIYLIIHGFKKA